MTYQQAMNIHITQLSALGLADFMRAFRLQKVEAAKASGTIKVATKFSAERMSRTLSYSASTVDNIESGKKPPSAEFIAAWCQYVNKPDWTVTMILQLIKERDKISVGLPLIRQYPELLDKVKELL